MDLLNIVVTIIVYVHMSTNHLNPLCLHSPSLITITSLGCLPLHISPLYTPLLAMVSTSLGSHCRAAFPAPSRMPNHRVSLLIACAIIFTSKVDIADLSLYFLLLLFDHCIFNTQFCIIFVLICLLYCMPYLNVFIECIILYLISFLYCLMGT